MSKKADDKIYKSIKTLKSFGTELSFDDNNETKIDNKNEVNASFSINEYFQKIECTLFYIGAIPVNQKAYRCSICNPPEDKFIKYICEFCYNDCHKICRKLKEEKDGMLMKEKVSIEIKDYIGFKEFFCVCGKEYKHIPPIPTISEFGPCDLMKLDEALKLENFYCENHNIKICSICSVQCHKKCKIIKSKETIKKNKRKIDRCNCRNECHTKYNEVAFTFPLNEYQKISGIHIWPIQILNILFHNRRTFHGFYGLFTALLENEQLTQNEEKKIISLLTLFSNTFNRKFKTFYYQEEILEMFNYEKLIKYIPTIKLNNTMNIELKFRLIFILLFVHLRKDFQNVKCITSIDFLCSTPLERLKYKTILGKQNVFNENIYKKYNNTNLMEENNIIKEIALNDISRLMEISIKYIDLEKIAYEFEVALKYICFILKKMLFTKEELIILIHYLKIFFEKFYDYIKNNNPNIYLLLNIFQGIVEIVFMISVTYNDLIIMEYLNKYKKEYSIENIKSIDDFIHVKSEYGFTLFQIVIKSCDILKDHYDRLKKRGEKIKGNEIKEIQIDKDTNIRLPENGGLFPEKIISLFTETLSIFSLADSFYYKQICSITKDNLINYYYFINKYEKNILSDFNVCEKSEIENLLLGLKNNIESIFINLLTSSYDGKTTEINKKIYQNTYQGIYQEISHFSQVLNNIMLNFVKKKNEQNMNINYHLKRVSTSFSMLNKQNTLLTENTNDKIINNESKDEIPNINYNNEDIEEENIKREELKNYLKKLALKNENYKFLKEMNNIDIEDLVDILIISNIDESMSKILSFLSNRNFPNLLTPELCDIIFSTLSLYFYSKNGMEYFLMGKNLSRINKIINRFNYNTNNKNINPELGKNIESNIKIMKRTIDFLLDVSKGIHIYELNIKYHKVLPRFKKHLLEHISTFNLISNNNLVEFSIHFKKTLKIFMYLKDFIKYEDFEDIKTKSILIFERNPSGLFNKNTFFKIVNSLQSNNEININTNNNNINKKAFLSLYFTFFKFVTINTFYYYNNKETNNIIKILCNFNDLNRIRTAFSNNIFTVKQKYILLEYMRTLYFSDYLDEYEILKQVKPLSNSEFFILIKNKLINTNLNPDDFSSEDKNKIHSQQNIGINYSNISQSILMYKYKRINDIEIILDIYSNEIKKFPGQLYSCDLKHCELFYKQILLDIKYISVFFYSQENNLYGKFKILFYGLTLEFLNKIDSFYKIYQNIKNSYKENNNKIIIKEENNEINNENNWSLEVEKINEKINDMKSISFNVYDKKKIYCYLTESIDILIKICKINLKYNLQNYLEYYDVMAESNFTPFSLLETLDYEYFYDDKEEKANELIRHDKYLYKIENLKTSFISTFIDINNTNFLDVITRVSEDNYIHDFRSKYIDYFLSFLNSNEGNYLSKLEINLCVLTKMMFYDSENMQNRFAGVNDNNTFFINLYEDINKFTVLVFSLSKNIFAFDIAGEITNINKLYIQFIQALGEGFNFTFHDNIFHTLKSNKEKNKEKFEEEKNEIQQKNYNNNRNIIKSRKSSFSKTLYDTILINLKYALYKLDLENMIDSELPYDKLIIFVSNSIDFIIEYISSTHKNNNLINKHLLKFLLGHTKTLKKSHDENSFIENGRYLKLYFSKRNNERINDGSFAVQRKKVICYTKIKLTQMIIYYLLTGGKDNFVETIEKNDFTTINLYSEILYNFNNLINHLELKNPELISKLNLEVDTVDEYTDKLINFYTYENDFRNMIELQLIFNYYILIKILEENYKYNHLNILFEKNKDNIDKNTFDVNGDFNLNSKFSKSVYKFLNIIILKVEIKMNDINDDNEEYNNDDENDNIEGNIPLHKNKNYEIAKKIKKYLKKDKTFSSLINKHKEYKQKKNVYEEAKNEINNNNKIENEESLSLSSNNDDDSSESENSEEKSNIKTIFFPRPFITFFLSKSTKNKILNTLDRSSNSAKFTSLLNYADYCLFEMIVNKHIIGSYQFNNFFVNLNYTYIEMLNYLFIVVQNFLILFRFYKKTDEPYEEYYTFDKNKIRKLYHENMIIAVLQIIFLGVFLILWYYYKFLNSCQNNIMKEFNKPFIGKRIGEDKKIPQAMVDYFQDKNISNFKFLRVTNEDLSNWEKFYVLVVSTHIENREIIILILSLILNIIFIGTKMPIFLVFQILFILNIISTLFDIVLAIKLKWKNIILLLLFDFLSIYIFTWLAFFYFSYFFVFDEVLIPQSQETISEGFCFSSVQCYLFILNRGSLSNGGISEDLERMSYKSDVSHYLGRYFFDVIFFLLISLYIGKMFLSFIIDTFGELRNKNDEDKNDKENVCFICQIERDKCLLKNIDFDKHVKNVHNIWNYVYFLNYLYVNNSLNFNSIENSVWEELQEQGINWFPLKED